MNEAYNLFDGIIGKMENDPGRLVDYGIENRWYFEKRENGSSMAFGRFDIHVGDATAWATTGFYYQLVDLPNFPSGLFSGTPGVVAIPGGAVLFLVCGQLSTPQKTQLYICNASEKNNTDIAFCVFAFES